MSKCLYVTKGVFLCVVVALVVLVATSGSAWAQAQKATITGTATDTTGAALAGAKIKVTNTETGVSQSTVTDAQGRFTVPDLDVGTYKVQASQSGFQTTVHTGVNLTVGATVVVNLTLPVGQVSQTVSVEANAVQVETQTSQISNLVAPKQVSTLPLNGRNIEQLLTLTPGVTAMAPAVNFVTGRMYGMQNNYSISGGRPTGQMFLLDGTDIRDFWEHGIGSGYAGTELGLSSISQFQVITSNGNAQYAGNGVVSEVSKSGTNNLHGSVYEYLRNSALDSMSLPDKLAGRTSPAPFRQNQFGVALGGPIKKNKLFYFGNYEGLRNSLSTTIPGFPISMPYVAQGMLPCYDITGAPVNTDPSSGTCPGTPPNSKAAGGSTPVPVGDPTIDPILGVSGALPLTEQIASLYALCTQCKPIAEQYQNFNLAPGTDAGGFTYVSTAPTLTVNEDYGLGRIDYNVGPSDSLFGRYVIDDARVLDGTRDALGIFPEHGTTKNQYLTIAENHIVSPTMVNVLRFGLVRTNEGAVAGPALSSAQLSAAGLTSDPLDLVRTLYNEPQRMDGQVTPYNGTALGPDPNQPNIFDNKFSGSDDLSWTHGSHTLKLGITVTRVQVNVHQVSYGAGETYGFGSLQGYLQGTGATFGFASPPGYADSDRYFREVDIAPYFQDDWRVTPQLTLNIGLRYDYGTNPVGWAGGNRSLTTLTGSFLPPVGPVTATPNCANPNNPAYIGTNPTLLQSALCGLTYFTPVKHVFAGNPNANNWEPRFGFAYSPFKDNKTAIRGGIGIFFNPTAARIYESGYVASPPGSSFAIFGPSFPDAFNANAPCPPSFFGGCPKPSEFAGVTYQNSDGSPYTLQYNFQIQQQLSPGTVLTVGYVGSVSRHLWSQRDINPPACLSKLNGGSDPNCTALPIIPKSYPTASGGGITVTNNCVPLPNSPHTQNTCYGSGPQFQFATEIFGFANNPQNRLNSAFGEMITEATTSASSYNSLQIGLNHQFSRNLSYQVNYTYSHCIDNGSFATSLEQFAQLVTDPYNQSYDYENCNFDVRHNLSVNGIYELPFKANRFVSGWEVSTILGVHSGMPVNVYNGQTLDPANLGTEWASRANYTFAPGCSPNQIIDKVIPNSNGVIQWFNPACYEPQAPGFLGNVRRNSIPGPGTLNLDLSVIKNTKITEKVNMQFRCEAFNVMNHFNPGAPSGAIWLNNGQDGQIRSGQAPVVTPRQIQFALKFQF